MTAPSPLKTAAICMVYNGYAYLSEFLSYHLDLCDHIYIIDHNSERDLRDMKLDRVTFVRSNHEAQFQSECTNTVIEHFNIKNTYDWLFVLDIDEFLPFSNREAFHTYLNRSSGSRALQFFWRNGVPFYDAAQEQPESLIECDSIRFFHKDSINYKTAVNIKRIKGNFVVPTGAHHISPAETDLKLILTRQKDRYLATISELPLFHIVAFNKDAFIKKIKIYVDQMKYREHVKGQGGWVVRDYPDELSHDQWLWYIANFRVADPTKFYDCKVENFIETAIFSHLSREHVIALRQQILGCAPMSRQMALPEEKEYLLYKKDDRRITDNIKWFRVTPENEIVTIVPTEHAQELTP